MALRYTTGWAVYEDTTYTEGSPLTLTGGSKITLPSGAYTLDTWETNGGLVKIVADKVYSYKNT